MSERALHGEAEDTEVIRYAAERIGIQAVADELELVVARKARQGPGPNNEKGFDFYLGRPDALGTDETTRLEVSGILDGDRAAVRERQAQKARRLLRHNDSGYVVIVELSAPLAQCTWHGR